MDLTSQTTFLSVAALGLAVCAGIYVLWGPDNWFRKRGHISELILMHDSCTYFIMMYACVCFNMQVVVLVLPILETRVS